MWEIKIYNAAFLIFQVICSAYDIRLRAVPRWLLLCGSALAAGARIAGIGSGSWIYVWGALTGGMFLIISKCTSEALGYADSWMIFVLGVYMGIWKLAVILSIAFFTAGLWSLGKVVLQKRGRKDTFPFLPFLTAGYLGVIGW